MKNTCDWYLEGFCCRDLDAGRTWDCEKKLKRIKKQENCEYYKLIEKGK